MGLMPMRALFALLLISPAFAETTATVTPRTWDLYRSTTRLSQHATLQACVDAAKALNVARSYTCRNIADVVVSIVPDCPPQPAAETRTQQCAAPLVGSWTQTRTYSSAPAPTCWTAGPWVPADASAGTCVDPTPTVTASAAPLSVAPNGSTTLTWSSTNAPSCAVMAGGQAFALPSTSGTVQVGPLVATVTFAVRCGTVESAPITITVGAVAQDLSWTAPTQRQDGSAISGPVQYVVRRDGQVITTTTARTLAAQPPGCYTVATVEGGVEGPQTNPLCLQ